MRIVTETGNLPTASHSRLWIIPVGNSLWTWFIPISRVDVWRTLLRDVTRMAILFLFGGLTAWFGKIAFEVAVIQLRFKGSSPHSIDSVR